MPFKVIMYLTALQIINRCKSSYISIWYNFRSIQYNAEWQNVYSRNPNNIVLENFINDLHNFIDDLHYKHTFRIKSSMSCLCRINLPYTNKGWEQTDSKES